jgi:hypothetical protein
MQNNESKEENMDNLLVSVYCADNNEWFECGGTEIPSNMDDDTACLIAKGLVFECDWTPGSVTMCILREESYGSRVIYEGL